MGARDSTNIKSNRLVQSYPRKKAKKLGYFFRKKAVEKMEWDNNCAPIHLSFRRHLHKSLPFLRVSFPTYANCVRCGGQYISLLGRPTVRARESVLSTLPRSFYTCEKSERVSFSLPSPFPNVFMSPSSFPLFSDISDFCTLEDLSSLSRKGKLACSSSLSPPGV